MPILTLLTWKELFQKIPKDGSSDSPQIGNTYHKINGQKQKVGFGGVELPVSGSYLSP